MHKWYVFINRVPFYFSQFNIPNMGYYWKEFDSEIAARIFAKINGYKLIAKGK